MTDIVVALRRPVLEVSGFKFRLWPIVLAAVLMHLIEVGTVMLLSVVWR